MSSGATRTRRWGSAPGGRAARASRAERWPALPGPAAMTEGGEVTRLAVALTYPEGPRWRDGALWFSEFSDRTINRYSPGGGREVVLRLEDTPSGLGFMP